MLVMIVGSAARCEGVVLAGILFTAHLLPPDKAPFAELAMEMDFAYTLAVSSLSFTCPEPLSAYMVGVAPTP